MKAEEFLIRFFAFHFRLNDYQKPLEAFLNTFTEHHRDDDEATLEAFEALFYRTIESVELLFGDLAFAIFDYQNNNQVVSSFNAALFDAEMLAVSRVMLSPKKITKAAKDSFLKDLGLAFYEDEFRNSIGRATSDVNQIRRRVALLDNLVTKHF